jgi:outer membrane protein OmpA-like peptidoglycan-associated protein
VKRYAGSLVLAYDRKNFDTINFPLSRVEFVPGKRDTHNNSVAEPKSKISIEGQTTHLVYVMPPERSSLEIVRYFQDGVKAQQGRTLYECQASDCGVNPTGNSIAGGGQGSLPMYIRNADQIGDAPYTIAWCAANQRLANLRYFVAEVPSSGAFVSVQTGTLTDAQGGCEALKNRTIAVVDVVVGKAVGATVAAAPPTSLSASLSSDGKVALYSFEFDTNKSALKPSADATLAQIGQLLTDQPQLKLLVVGHTDNEGGYAANLDLSKQRANAIVSALVKRYKVKAERLTAVGVSSAAPLASNKTPEGRAKNRRVELVEK